MRFKEIQGGFFKTWAISRSFKKFQREGKNSRSFKECVNPVETSNLICNANAMQIKCLVPSDWSQFQNVKLGILLNFDSGTYLIFWNRLFVLQGSGSFFMPFFPRIDISFHLYLEHNLLQAGFSDIFRGIKWKHWPEMGL